MNCKTCKYYNGPFLEQGVDTDWYKNAGECTNPKVWNDTNDSDVLVRAGGFEGYGDYFHVKEDFGCVKWEKDG